MSCMVVDGSSSKLIKERIVWMTLILLAGHAYIPILVTSTHFFYMKLRKEKYLTFTNIP